ncbi:MAG: glycosyltransferase [Bacteroidales bacterium]|nr:glycosyltransferase [Bacteroidales bacterium]
MITYLSYIHSWLRLIPDTVSDEANLVSSSSPLITIGVALHNEESVAGSLVLSLSQLVSPKILVLDHCSDSTLSVINSSLSNLTDNQKSLFSILINDGPQGKKFAQHLLVEAAKTPYVLATDADCLLSALWEQSVLSHISRHRPDLLLLPVGVHNIDSSLRDTLFSIDFLSLQMATIGCALSGRPTMANGANICFSKDLYLSHNANTDYASGDDMFLLSEAKRLNKSVEYCYNPDAIVRTTMPSSWRSFFNQHARWFRKSSGYSDYDVIRLGWATFSATFFWPLLAVCLPVYLQWITLACFMLKTVYEYRLLKRAEVFFSHRISLSHTVIFALIYPILTLVIVLKAAFKDRRSW